MDALSGTVPWAWVLAGSLIAQIIGTVTGFGAATILTPVAMLFLDPKSAVAAVAWYHLFANIARLLFFFRWIDWRVALRFGVSGVACGLAGAYLTVGLPSAAIEIFVGVFLLAYVAVELASPRGVRIPHTNATLVVGGALSGFIAGLIGTGGAIRSACLLAFSLPKQVYLATSAVLAMFVDATRLPVYVSEGLLPRSGALLAGLVVTALLGSWMGRWMAGRLSGRWFLRLVLALLAVSGVKFVMDGWAAWSAG